jgi:hypothetical protein
VRRRILLLILAWEVPQKSGPLTELFHSALRKVKLQDSKHQQKSLRNPCRWWFQVLDRQEFHTILKWLGL